MRARTIRLLYTLAVLSPLSGGAGAQSLQPLGCLIEPHRVVELGSPVIGVIESIGVERGDRVRKGQVIAVLRADVERAAVGVAATKAQVAAEVQAAQANYDLARRKYERAKDLMDRSFISSQALEQASADADVAEQKLAQAREQRRIWDRELKLAEAQLGMRTIRSPANGVIAERYLSPGERVEEKPIVRLATIDPLRIEVVVPAQLFGSIQAGSWLNVVPELPNARPRLAKVVLVDPLIDGPSNTFRARLQLPNANYEVPAGLRCSVELGTEGPARAAAEQPLGKPVPEVRRARSLPQGKSGGKV
jgi:membrane fusion protein, heavy metal efflux system